MRTYTNERGNSVVHNFFENRERYHYDFKECCGDGWRQYDTSQDAWYYGVWVNMESREIVTFAEGDEYRIACDTVDGFKKEIDHLNAFHGDPPPAFTVIDLDNSTVTKYYNERPKID